MTETPVPAERRPHVGLFVTCLVDLFRPTVGFAAVKLLEDAGCTVVVPSQTCCGQPAYNSGDRSDAKMVARQVIAAFADVDYVVAPSGSCAGMIREHYPELFADEPETALAAQHLAKRTHELVSFLVDVRGVGAVAATFTGSVTYHDSCSGLRELGVKQQPRTLLRSVDGLSPSAVAARLNGLVEATDSFFATLVAFDLDQESGELRYCSAGHLPPLLLTADGRCEFLSGAESLPLGVGADTPFEEARTVLEPSDLVLFYTDGLVERPGFGIDEALDGLCEAVVRLHGCDPEELLERLLGDLIGDRLLHDDVAVLVLQRAG